MLAAIQSSVAAQQGLSKTASGIAARLSGVDAQIDSLDKFVSRTASLSESFNDMVRATERIVESADGVTKKMSSASETIDVGSRAVSDALTDLKENINGIGTTLGHEVDIVRRHHDALEAELRQSRGSVQKVQQNLTDAVETIVKHLGS
jgi:ABC-type transporter Mla subunit MlaD